MKEPGAGGDGAVDEEGLVVEVREPELVHLPFVLENRCVAGVIIKVAQANQKQVGKTRK